MHSVAGPTNSVSIASISGGRTHAAIRLIVSRSATSPSHTSTTVAAYCTNTGSTPRVNSVLHKGSAVEGAREEQPARAAPLIAWTVRSHHQQTDEQRRRVLPTV